nr:hypothetical protein JVH1_0757 [Rhodococcus sp. JVH1]
MSMTTNQTHEITELLPEHAPRLDWAQFAPEAYKGHDPSRHGR